MVLVAVEWLSIVVYSGVGVETHGLFGMTTEQMAQMSAVGEPATNVPTKSGKAEIAVSSSDGNSHRSWRCASCPDDVRCP